MVSVFRLKNAYIIRLLFALMNCSLQIAHIFLYCCLRNFITGQHTCNYSVIHDSGRWRHAPSKVHLWRDLKFIYSPWWTIAKNDKSGKNSNNMCIDTFIMVIRMYWNSTCILLVLGNSKPVLLNQLENFRYIPNLFILHLILIPLFRVNKQVEKTIWGVFFLF